jgi:TPR repeat protein
MALRYFMKAAKQNHPSAILHIGVMYYNGIGLGTPDYGEALKKFKEAADLGNISAQCNLAMMYKTGQGTNK